MEIENTDRRKRKNLFCLNQDLHKSLYRYVKKATTISFFFHSVIGILFLTRNDFNQLTIRQTLENYLINFDYNGLAYALEDSKLHPALIRDSVRVDLLIDNLKRIHRMDMRYGNAGRILAESFSNLQFVYKQSLAKDLKRKRQNSRRIIQTSKIVNKGFDFNHILKALNKLDRPGARVSVIDLMKFSSKKEKRRSQMKIIKSFITTAAFFVLFCLQGCYISEFIETRIFLGEKNTPTRVEITYRNISSGEALTKDVKKDFESLINDWKEDKYLLERSEEGLFIKERELFVQEEKIIGRIKGIMKKLTDNYSFWVSNGERIMIFDAEDYKLVESNGQILKTNKNTLIVWSDDVKELYWKKQISEPIEDFDKNRRLMVKWLKEYFAQHPKEQSKI